jgi:hypothetical protein
MERDSFFIWGVGRVWVGSLIARSGYETVRRAGAGLPNGNTQACPVSRFKPWCFGMEKSKKYKRYGIYDLAVKRGPVERALWVVVV